MWPKKPQSSPWKDDLEERPSVVSTVTTIKCAKPWDLLHKYSNLTRLLRIISICRRVIAQFQRLLNSSLMIPITTIELENARLFWVKTVQQSSFHQEISILTKGDSLPKSNPLVWLTPFIDSIGLLRIERRPHSSLLPLNGKHPLILPKNSTLLTSLIISDAHLRTMHGGTQITLAFIRNDYWIIGERNPIRSFILKCVPCIRYRQKKAQQLMGQLPVERLTPSLFLNSGVNYAGPFLLLKTWKGRNSRSYKAYIALFVCHSTSAIHIELITDYTTEAFIAAYKRFTARRGVCATLMSDCGTKLKGADSELQKLFSSSSKKLGNLTALLANDGTQWKFNPPAAPHFGGKWEIRRQICKISSKKNYWGYTIDFRRDDNSLKIEAVLNSRPLCLSDNPKDLNALIISLVISLLQVLHLLFQNHLLKHVNSHIFLDGS